MSEAGEQRKLPLIAIGSAVLALVFALVAVIVVITRRDEAPPTKAAVSAGPVLVDQTVKAVDVLELKAEAVELVVEAGDTKGVRFKDATHAKKLGLEPDDVIVAISGISVAHEYAMSSAMSRLSMGDPTTIYLELLRKGTPVVMRWKLDGGLREARRAALANYPSLSALAGSSALPTPPDLDDAAFDSIVKLDDTTVKLPRALVDKILANPMAVAKGARVVPAIKNGQANGFKLYAIRPNSVYAKLGFSNGDTIHAINGFELTSPDKALEVYTKLRTTDNLTIDITRRGVPMSLSITITK